MRARLRDGAEAALSTDADRFALCLAGVERADAKLEAVVFMVRAALERTHARTHTRAHLEGWPLLPLRLALLPPRLQPLTLTKPRRCCRSCSRPRLPP